MKLVARELDPDEQAYRRQRLQAEIDAGQIVHEHVRRMLDFGSDTQPVLDFSGGVDWIALEWVEGMSLRHALAACAETRNELAARDLRDVTRSIANGLAALHRAPGGWVHRDVKPANILVPHGDFRSALLADMGIAWRTGSVRVSRMWGRGDSGTPLYMAPEQFASDDAITAAADQYSLALVLWEAATGVVPFSESTRVSDIARARLSAAPLPEFAVGGASAPNLRAVLTRALNVDPAHRWPDVGSFWRAFHAAGVTDRLWDPDISFDEGATVEAATPDISNPADADTDPSLYAVTAVWLEQEAHERAFVGRAMSMNRSLSWIRGELSAQSLVVVGPPGQGKSAFLAHLATMEGASRTRHERRIADHACLLHMVKAHRDPRRILQAYIAQADNILGEDTADDVMRGSEDDLRELLTSRLRALAQRKRRVTVILDAVDELPVDAQDLGFLPPVLPKNVKWVFSTRPDENILRALRTRFHPVDEEVLPPLAAADAEVLVSRAFGIDGQTLRRVLDVDELLAMTNGSPLVLSYAVRSLAAAVQRALLSPGGRRVSLAPVARSTDDVFGQAYKSVTANRGLGRGEDQVLAAALFQALACAEAPLDIAQIRSVLRVAGHPSTREGVEGLIEGVSQFLTARRGKYALFHKGFADYIKMHVLDRDGEAKVHDWFITSVLGESPTSRYGLHHLPEHFRLRFLAASELREDVLPHLRRWLQCITSLRFARSVIEGVSVFAYSRALFAAAEGVVDAESRTVKREFTESALAELLRLKEWVQFLQRERHILAMFPRLVTQQLRHSVHAPTLRSEAEREPLVDGMLLVKQAHVATRGVDRVERRSTPISPVGSIALHPSGRMAVSCHNDSSVAFWDLETCEKKSAGFANQPFCVGNALSRWVALATAPVEHDAHILLLDGTTGESFNVLWPRGAEKAGPVSLSGDSMFAALMIDSCWSICRFALPSGEWLVLTTCDRAPTRLVVPTSGDWVAIGYESDRALAGGTATGEVTVLDGTDGRHLGRMGLDKEWFGVTPHGLLLVASRQKLRGLAMPSLEEQFSVDVECQPWRAVFHPGRQCALLFDEDTAKLLSLAEGRILSSESWQSSPADPALLSADGTVLCGQIRVTDSPYEGEDAPLAVWKIPGGFWEGTTNDHVGDEGFSFPLCRRVVGYVEDTGYAQPASGLLTEFERGTVTPRRAFVGDIGGADKRLGLIEGTRLYLPCKSGVSVFDTVSGTLVRRLFSRTDTLMGIAALPTAGCARSLWFVGPADPERETSRLGDFARVELLSRNIETVELGGEVPTISIHPVTSAQHGAFVSCDINLETAELTACSTLVTSDWITGDWEFVCGAECVLVRRETADAYIVDARSGETILELGDDCRPLATFPDGRLLYCDFSGATWIVDVNTQCRTRVGLDLGWEAHYNWELSFALAPDGLHAAWNDQHGIVYGNIETGREIGRFPIERWDGDLSFEDGQTIRADGYRASYVLSLVDQRTRGAAMNRRMQSE